MRPGTKAGFVAAYDIALALYAVVLGAALGLGSALWMIDGELPFGRQEVGPWRVWPQLGSRSADPYARAILARNGDIPLGAGEGLAFHATVDDDGRPLAGACSYFIEGPVPPARFWTLTIYGQRADAVEPEVARPAMTSSAQVVRSEDGSARIEVSSAARPGNWIAPPDDGRFEIVLRLYDTQSSGALTRFSADGLPSIRREECAS